MLSSMKVSALWSIVEVGDLCHHKRLRQVHEVDSITVPPEGNNDKNIQRNEGAKQRQLGVVGQEVPFHFISHCEGSHVLV